MELIFHTNQKPINQILRKHFEWHIMGKTLLYSHRIYIDNLEKELNNA